MAYRGIIGQALSRIGAIIVALCCLGFAPILGVLTAIGAGFLLNDRYLLPLFILFLTISLLGLRRGKKLHGNKKPFVLGSIFSIAALVFAFFVRHFPLFTYLSLAGLVSIYIWDFYLFFKHRKFVKY